MQEILTQLADVAQKANESPETRSDRLSTTADSAGIDPTTLYEVEEDIRGLAVYYANQNPEKLAQGQTLASAYAPMLGIDPAAASQLASTDTLAALGGQYATARPAATALLVKTLHESFERNGLYEELGTETPPAGALAPSLTVDGGDQ